MCADVSPINLMCRLWLTVCLSPFVNPGEQKGFKLDSTDVLLLPQV
jgi:hypothetical protein